MSSIKTLLPPATMIDAEERARLHPKTFQIPDLEERLCGEVGCFAQVGFDHPKKAVRDSGSKLSKCLRTVST
jgi:hypothetical protein